MKIINVSRYLLEYFMTEGEKIRAAKVTKGIPFGCKLVHVEFDQEIVTLYFAEKHEVSLPMNPEIIPKVGGDEIAMCLESIDNEDAKT